MPDQSNHRLPEEFGGNEWLVDELYEQYLKDKNSVDKKWWSIFDSFKAEDSQQSNGSDAGANGGGTQAAPRELGSNPTTRQLPVVQAEKTAPKASGESPASAQQSGKPPVAKEPAKAPAPKPAAAQKAESKQESKPAPIPAQLPKTQPSTETEEDKVTVLRGPAKAIATNMDLSLSVPTATTVRAIPAKLLIDNRIVINSHLERARGGKISFTHLLGYAIIRAAAQFPSMNVYYDEVDGKPVAVSPAHVNFGLAIDMPKPDGTRLLVVPNIKKAETLNFSEFWHAYEDLVKRARSGKLGADDYKGTTISLTNPGGIGTVHSVPRLSKGQAAIIGAGALEYPAEFQGSNEKILARNAISKVITLTSTYDHRVIQGAGSGEFLRIIHQLLLGEQNFYDDIFESLRIPYEPVRWSPDIQVNPEEQVNKVARIQQLIHSYRVRGHLMADTNPLEYVQRRHADLDILNHGLTLWDLDREWPTGGFGGQPMLKLRKILGVLRDAYCRTAGIEYMHIQDPEERQWFQDRLETRYSKPTREEQLRILAKLNAAEAFETFLQTKFVGQKRFSLEGGESLIPLLDTVISGAADAGLEEVGIGMAHRGRLNVLTNIAGKTYAQVFREFEGTQDPRSVQGSGDVKYHLGTEGRFTSDNGNETKVYLAANPSHLEAGDSVLEGIVRAKQDRLDRGDEFPVLPILIHGDAAFAGQGVVAETLNLSQLRGYRTGGTIHVTQPMMYSLIEAKRSVRKLYTESLIGRGDISQEEAEQALRDYQGRLERVFAETHAAQTSPIPVIGQDTEAVSDLERPAAQQEGSTIVSPATTAIAAETLAHIGKAHIAVPEGFTVHPKLKSLLEKREQMSREGGIDWGFAEIAAFGSLVMEGVPVRLAGQDSRRGTFTQRHAVFHDRATGAEWMPLAELDPNQAKLWIYDSLLSEFAAMGFEYGYSVERPDALVLWEAQFGDFVNGAQTIIDEFISSAEQKWGQRSSLVLMLPHGYEGQGPDHSSARIERFLQMCAEDNMIVANPTTGASHFHLLRRQAYSRPRKPLVVFTPKQLLRLKAAATSVEDFTQGSFQPVIGEHADLDANAVDRVLLVSGRLYYDLLANRQKTGDDKTAIVRVEQLYPLPADEIRAAVAKYPKAELVWAQDEPANQGPWPFIGLNLPAQLDRPLRLVSRPASASTATGSAKRHAVEQDILVKKAFERQ